jgi:hypothetical protein
MASAALATFALGENQAMPSTTLRMSLLFALWMLLLYSFIHLFQNIPPPVLPALSWSERSRQRLHLLGYRALACAVAVSGAVLLSISVKLWLL